MKRLFTNQLEKWEKSKNRKPLIVRGARQVGKSYIIAQFGKSNFKGKIHIVDFEKYPAWRDIFEQDLNAVRIISELEILLNSDIIQGEDLLFFDEIQEAPRALMSLRYFYEDLPGLHVIAAGSLLEFALSDISFPVGRVEILNLNPMSFYEFLLANDQQKAAEIILQHPKKLSDTIHNMLIENLRLYMYVGGMPECVDVWCKSKSLKNVFSVQDSLLDTYRQDFSKYAPFTDKRSLNNVLNSVGNSIGHQIKYSRLSDEFTSPTNKKAFDLLVMSRVVRKIKSASPASLPLNATASEKRFKSILLDIGLMRSLNDLPANVEYVKNNLLAMYSGALSEQFVGQEFISSGSANLFYWSREAKSSSAEVDYLIVRNNNIYPVEIKGGAAGKLRSMHQILKDYPKLKHGFVLSMNQYAELPAQKLVFLPLYYAYYLSSIE